MTDLYEIIEKAEREAYRKGLKLYSMHLKLTQRNKDTADRILDDMIKGEITYQEALKKLQKLYKKQQKKIET